MRVCLVAVVALCAGARTVAADPDPAPREPRPVFYGGAALFTGAYVAAALVATTSYDAPDGTTPLRGDLWIPIVGPFIELDRGSAAARVGLALDGVAQIGGVAAMAYAIAHPRRAQRGVTVAPLVGAATGLALVGRF